MAGKATLLHATTLVLAALAVASVSMPLAAEPEVPLGSRRAVKKAADADAPSPAPLLATLVQVHTAERVALAPNEPTAERFAALLADRTTGETRALDPRLLDLLRAVAARYPYARLELVSGFRSPKLNERLRKKGHHVASHSQHSLGHAVDFRVVPDGQDAPVAPAELEALVRSLGWDGGVGVYPTENDRFVHCDVGPRRRWTSN